MDWLLTLFGLLGLTITAYIFGFVRGIEKAENYALESIREMEARMLRKLETKFSLDERPDPSDTKRIDESEKKRQ